MRLVALLSFFDEPPEDLIRCVTSLQRAGVDHVVAVDGPYALFPHELVASHPSQHAAIRTACWSGGMGLTLHVPSEAWQGNEIEKRTFMHRLALALTNQWDSESWHFVIDADEVVDQAPDDLRRRLKATFNGVAEVMTREAGGGEGLRRRLFAAQPVEVGPGHCRYVNPITGAVLSDSGQPEETPALIVADLVLAHRKGVRQQIRLDRKMGYYAALPEGGHLTCERCARPASQRVRVGFRVVAGDLLSDPLDVCQFCADQVRGESAVAVRALGFDPDRVAI